MQSTPGDGTHGDRRWHPPGDTGEWARTTREKLFVAVTRCIAQAIAKPHEAYASDETFAELNECVAEYARGLCGLGKPEDDVVMLVLQAAKQAAEPRPLHPALAAALEEWSREACGDAHPSP